MAVGYEFDRHTECDPHGVPTNCRAYQELFRVAAKELDPTTTYAPLKCVEKGKVKVY